MNFLFVTNTLHQRFSTQDKRTPGGTREALGGTQNVTFTDTKGLGGTREALGGTQNVTFTDTKGLGGTRIPKG